MHSRKNTVANEPGADLYGRAECYKLGANVARK